MKTSRILWLWAFVLLSCSAGHAQKVLDRSEKKRPDWVGVARQDYLVVSATGSDLETAMQKSLTSVKVQMLEAVAQNVEYSTETLIEQFTVNQDVESSISFRQSGKTSVARLPFLSGITLAKAESSYWELVQDNVTGERYYAYSLLYPFPVSEQYALKEEFEEIDNEMTAMVQRYEQGITGLTDIDSIAIALSDLGRACNYYFDARRRSWAEKVADSYRGLYSGLNIESERTDKCKYKVFITLGGKVMRCSTVPKMKSDCATGIKCTSDGQVYTVTFSTEDCVPDEANSIELTFRLGHCTLKHRLEL